MNIIPIIDEPRFGNTNPVANCSKAFGIDPYIGFVVADAILHGSRNNATEEKAYAALELVPMGRRQDFLAHIGGIASRAVVWK